MSHWSSVLLASVFTCPSLASGIAAITRKGNPTPTARLLWALGFNMSEDLEFLKSEVARLRFELVIGDSPLQNLAIQKEIDKTEKIIAALEQCDVTPKTSESLKVNPVKCSTTEPSTNIANNKKPPDGISFRHFAFGVSVAVFSAICIVVINHYLGIQL